MIRLCSTYLPVSDPPNPAIGAPFSPGLSPGMRWGGEREQGGRVGGVCGGRWRRGASEGGREEREGRKWKQGGRKEGEIDKRLKCE